MYKPSVTYRIQFNKEFNFKSLNKVIPYLKELGVDTIYASPIFAAVPGSTHGYDGVNPLQINPEIGTEAELFALSDQLRQLGIGWLQDIVPNHMAFHPHNAWLMDVLEHWDKSPYFSFFDLNFPTKMADERLMVPFLGETLADALSEGMIKLEIRDGKIYLSYGDAYWPINQSSYQTIFNEGPKLEQMLQANHHRTATLKNEITRINKNTDLLGKVVNQQYYRLCHWQETDKQINYRRFFTVNGLICLNIQHKKVFDAYHQYIIYLTKKGIFQGLRIDHVDGLADPKTYLQRLRSAVGQDCYLVVEKILEANEQLPSDWPIAGTTGYDFLAIVNNLLTNRKAEKPFNKLYRQMIDKKLDPAAQTILKKGNILLQYMQGELDHLVILFLQLRLGGNKKLRGETVRSLKAALADLLIYCPVYRYYGNSTPLKDTELKEIQQLLDNIPVNEHNNEGLNLLRHTLAKLAEGNRQELLQFYQRLMQFSGPLMAKGIEDTLMYTYNRFIGHGEVGDSPAAFGIVTEDFHNLMMARQDKLPLSINATATHDTKRGEDVRARLNVLTDLPGDWKKLLVNLMAELKLGFKKKRQLHQNDIYLVLQTIVGILPYKEQDGNVEQRVHEYLQKALREAKKRSDWANPNETYEQNVMAFASSLLQPKQKSFQLIADFLERISDYGITNSLIQLLLKFTCPGIPDIYQGCELWDLSMVDPDNRRPVDYNLRSKSLQETKNGDFTALWQERKSGEIKLALTQKLITIRKAHQDLFNFGSYVPLQIRGKYQSNILAFLRQYKQQYLVVVVPLGFAKINGKGKNISDFDWEDTAIIPPIIAPHGWQDLLNEETGEIDVLADGILIGDIFTTYPFALLSLKDNQPNRGSGILLPLFSLPSKTGIGNLGKEAFNFIDFLARCHQKYWQLLPLNPTTALQHYSPYSAFSAMAGNILYIDPMFFVEKGWLKEKDLNLSTPLSENIVDYKYAEIYMGKILHKAYENYRSQYQTQDEFKVFCKKEAYWLDDFAVFMVLREQHNYIPWNEWPEAYKFRKPKAIALFSKEKKEKIIEIKWQQFIFHQQWLKLKNHANSSGIKLIGDLPFYVDHNAVDVWANPEVFMLNEQLEMEVVAGVPPDMFNKEGQRWGLPIFNWKYLKSTQYQWWIERIRKNIELFDLVRLDHFRAFHSYWQIEAAEVTAKNGQWILGPGSAFLGVMCKTFDDRSLIVEDLGGDMEGPIKLREAFNLAGMRVLQFAFGADVGANTHAPHNFQNPNTVVYVGTHDNNTAKGWFLEELDLLARERLNLYVGKKVNAENVAAELIKLALKSTAKIAIIQLQDILGLDSTAKINTPATIGKNWLWRLKKGEIEKRHENWLRQQTQLFGRG